MSGWEFFFSLIICFILIVVALGIVKQKVANKHSTKIVILIMILFFPSAFYFFGNYDIKIVKNRYTDPIHFEQYKNFVDEKHEYKAIHALLEEYKEADMNNKKENVKEILREDFQRNNKREVIYKIQHYLDKLYSMEYGPNVWKEKETDMLFYNNVPEWIKVRY